jgi:hypothetical protein
LTKQDYAYNIIFVFTIPFVAAVRTIKSKSARYKHQLLTLLIGLYGSTISIGQDADGTRHLATVTKIYADMPFKQFFYEISQILTFQITDSGASDLYKHFLSYFCGAVLEMPFLFFPIVALVYGYFFSGSLLIVLEKFHDRKKTWLIIGFTFLLILYESLEGINTVRTWTGMWVLVYASLKYYKTKQKKYLLLMFIPPFIHVAYFAMALPAYVVLIFGNRKLVYTIIFVLSSFVSFINPANVTDNMQETELGAKKSKAYGVEEEVNIDSKIESNQKAGKNWYVVIQKAGVQNYALTLLIYVFVFFGIYFSKMSKLEASIFSIGLLTLALSNLSWFLYALQNRSAILGGVFILAGFLLYAYQNPHSAEFFKIPLVNFLLLICFLGFIPTLFFKLSNLFGYVSFYNLFAPFAVWIDPDINMSVKDFVKVVIGMKSL